MIQALFAQLADAWSQLVAGQTPAPTLTLVLDKLELSQRARDRSSQPRPQAVQESLALNLPTTPRYALAQTPLAGSLQSAALFKAGQPEEQRIPLRATVDYTVDLAAPALLLTAQGQQKAADATHLLLTYTYGGVFATQEFSQHFQATVQGASWPVVEQWAALFLALVLTDHDAWVERYNRAQTTPARAGPFVSRPLLDHLTVREGTPAPAGETPCLCFHCVAGGCLEVGKQTPAFGVIEEVIMRGAG